MFDLNATDGSVQKKPYESPLPKTKDPKPVPQAQLDSNNMQALHRRLLDLWDREMERQAENRMDQSIDEDVYDSIQWSETDKATLEERGQVPLVFNVTATTIDWVLGTEKRTRTDFKVLPRRKQDGKPAQRKSELLKYLSDVNREPFEVSRAFADAAKVGIGWLEDGYQDDDDGEEIYTAYENWRNMLWDSTSTRPDLEDARYVGRSKWIDLDVAKAMFPKRYELLCRSVDDADNFTMGTEHGDFAMDQIEALNTGGGISGTTSDRVTGYRRHRLRIHEMWIRMPATVKKMKGGIFRGEIFDQYSPAHQEQLETGEAETVEKPAMRMYVALFTSAGMLWFSPSPYRHNRFPFTPIWHKRRGRDGMPYGLVRNLRDIQTDINKRASKALHILSTNRIIMDADAVDDIDALIEEAARPDAVIVKKKGSELSIGADKDNAQWQMEFMSRDIAMMQQVGGVTDENLGRTTNAVSGVAIEARQSQGQLATAGLFDNLRLAMQVRGEKKLSLTEQFMSEQKQFRITNQRGQPEYVDINDGLPDNDIIRTKADFVISEEDWRSTMRQAQVDSLMELIGKLAPVAPQVAIVTLDLVVESMDLPNSEELVKRIRQVTGMTDPDAEQDDPDNIARQQAQAAQQELQQRQAMAELGEKEAKAKKLEAEVEALKAKIANTNVLSQNTALDAAAKVAVAPALADVSDVVLHESGFISRTETEETMKAMAEQAQAAQQQAAAAQQQQAAAQQQQQPAGQDQPAPTNPEAPIGLGQ